MRSIQARFKQQERITPKAGAYINLQRAIRGQRFLHSAIVKAFKDLVPKDDYGYGEKTALVEWLDLISVKPRRKIH